MSGYSDTVSCNDFEFYFYFFQEDKSRVEVFREYARKNKESVWMHFLNMLNRPDGFIINQVWYAKLLLLVSHTHFVYLRMKHQASQVSCFMKDLCMGSKWSLFSFTDCHFHIHLEVSQYPVWTDVCHIFQTSRIVAKIACWGQERMEGADLHFYLQWLKEQMKMPVMLGDFRWSVYAGLKTFDKS